MKAGIYIFGNFADGYSQHPDDYTKSLFKSISKSRKGASEIVYHREGALTYYIYMREISQPTNTYIGLCYVFNDIIIRDFACLFNIFEDAITDIVVKGEFLEFTDDGSLSTKVNQLYTNTDELQRVADYLNGKLSFLGKYIQKLPPANYSVSATEWKSYAYDQITSAQKSINNYSNVRVIKGENYDTEALKGYAAKLKSKDAIIRSLQQEVANLKDENLKLNRKKKQFLSVVILSSLLLIGSVITAVVIANKNSDINDKIAKIESLSQTKISLESQIDQLNNDIEGKNEEIDELRRNFNAEHNRYLEYKDKYDTLLSSISNRQPFIITNTSFSFSSGWFTMNYYGLTSGSYNIRVNVYTDGGSRIQSKLFSDYYFYEGNNSKDFYISTSLNSSSWYYFEVCIDNVIIGGGRH